ncbi:hypothetical protein PQJ75_13510 [Rhodoplanes sp. TEM]|uniref:Uncharacterized protein n=1 Tax=Rhodoplanes tepidamans TaxID=200616 RepID=A0ABT5JDE0_RHOTP|nr:MULTISPECIES: hypothetical protein [Rhodoplanes]MDC7787371.1 hypothetical protein [Rhodoplanes tepidamans]MDC7984747.1 hypothetical protein [Rhodoplanes sp. TEM]MDQ0358282.1 hypothetical protein [Rhodoplanes tepidamans]
MNLAISNLRYADPTSSLIDMDVSVDGGEPFPFTLSHSDPAPVAEAVWAAMAEGTYEVAPYVPPPDPVPDISDRQFFQQLAIDGVVTQAEALAAVKTGSIPAALQAIVDTIADPGERFSAEMILSGATVYQRTHPLTEAVRLARGMTPEACDNFFRAAAAL